MPPREQPKASGRLTPGRARRAAFNHLFELLRIMQKPRWATPVLIALGFASSLAESLGITLVVLFFY